MPPSRDSAHVANEGTANLAHALLGLVTDLEAAFGRCRERLLGSLDEEADVPIVRGDRQRAIASLKELFGPAGMTAGEIAGKVRYDEANTYTVLDSLVKTGLLELVPNASPRRWRMAERHRRDRVLLASQLIEPGEWTTYGDVAIAVYGNVRMARAVGQSAAWNPAFSNPHRVIGRSGIIPAGWQDGRGGGPETCRRLLERDKVSFDDRGRAKPQFYVGWQQIEDRLAATTAETEE
jgi:O6-methylguanine-DNA--protein-cysteine methyltransferase